VKIRLIRVIRVRLKLISKHDKLITMAELCVIRCDFHRKARKERKAGASFDSGFMRRKGISHLRSSAVPYFRNSLLILKYRRRELNNMYNIKIGRRRDE